MLMLFRFTGDVLQFAEINRFAWEASERGQEINIQALPSQVLSPSPSVPRNVLLTLAIGGAPAAAVQAEEGRAEEAATETASEQVWRPGTYAGIVSLPLTLYFAVSVSSLSLFGL
jgi:hypothetical protein